MEKFFKRPWLVVGVIAAITAFFALQLPRVELDNDATGFIPEDNEAYRISEHLEEVYGEDEGVVMFVGLERKQGTVFDQAFLSRLREFTDAVEDISVVEDSASILTMPYITGKDDSIIVADLVDDDFTGTPAEIAELKRRLSSWDLYKGQLVSDNFSATQVIINLNIATEDLMRDDVNADVANIRKTANTMFDGLATVYLAGQPVMTDTTNNAMMTDLTVLIPLALVVILAVLLFSFRRWTFVALPLLTVVVAVIWAMGAMPLLGFKMSFMMVILPIILIAVGSAYGIHVVSHYLDAVKGQALSRDKHREFVFSVLRKVLKPVLLAALTTMAGFVSFCFTYLVPMRSFGYFSCFGVTVALIAAITLIPALLLIRGPEKEKVVKKARGKKLSRLDTALGDIFTAIAGKKAAVLAITAVVLAVSIYGLSKVVVDSSMVEFFSDDSDISRSDRFIREYFGGSTQLTLSVEADTTEALLNPRTLTALDDLAVYLAERVPHVGKVAGFTDMIKRMNQLFNAEEPPEGVRIKSAVTTSEDSGFGDFGIDDFGGFGEFDASEAGGTESIVTDVSQTSNSQSVTVPDLLSLMETASANQSNMSASDLVRELARITNYEGSAYYEIPADPARYGKETQDELGQIISNYLVLVGSDADGGYSNNAFEPTAIRSAIQIKSQWQRDTQAVVDAVNEYVSANFPDNVKVVVGGSAQVQGEITGLVMNSQIISIAISILMVFIIIGLANRSVIAGVFAAVPLAIAILCNFGVMGLLGITLNMGTALISSLAVGIGIDYTIHFMEFFKTEYRAGGDYLRRTFAGSGKAILINALSWFRCACLLAVPHDGAIRRAYRPFHDCYRNREPYAYASADHPG